MNLSHITSSKDSIKQAYRILRQEYPQDFLGNKKNPLDEYLYITLSLRTHEKGFVSAYAAFKKRFPSWHNVWRASNREIVTVIKSGGLANQKAANIKRALDIIYDEFGEVSLRYLKKMRRQEVEAFLLKLPGIGLKSAKCIMMYSLGFAVLPVDTHVARISYRLGWVDTRDLEKLHMELERLVPPKHRFSFHVCCVQHGRAVCKGQYPQCEICCLTKICRKVGITEQ